MRSQWKRIRYRLEWIGLLLATKLIPLCSRRVCHYLARLAGALLSFIDRPRSRVALSNLVAAFGDRFSPTERRTLARHSFQHFEHTMRDLLWGRVLTQANCSSSIHCPSFEETVRRP